MKYLLIILFSLSLYNCIGRDKWAFLDINDSFKYVTMKDSAKVFIFNYNMSWFNAKQGLITYQKKYSERVDTGNTFYFRDIKATTNYSLLTSDGGKTWNNIFISEGKYLGAFKKSEELYYALKFEDGEKSFVKIFKFNASDLKWHLFEKIENFDTGYFVGVYNRKAIFRHQPYSEITKHSYFMQIVDLNTKIIEEIDIDIPGYTGLFEHYVFFHKSKNMKYYEHDTTQFCIIDLDNSNIMTRLEVSSKLFFQKYVRHNGAYYILATLKSEDLENRSLKLYKIQEDKFEFVRDFDEGFGSYAKFFMSSGSILSMVVSNPTFLGGSLKLYHSNDDGKTWKEDPLSMSMGLSYYDSYEADGKLYQWFDAPRGKIQIPKWQYNEIYKNIRD